MKLRWLPRLRLPGCPDKRTSVGSIDAPAGAPGSREYVIDWAGRSESVALATKLITAPPQQYNLTSCPESEADHFAHRDSDTLNRAE